MTANLVLSSDVPHSEADVLVLHSLHVEPDGGDGCDNFTQLQLVQDGGLAGGVEADHKDAHLLLPQPLEQSREQVPHDYG